MTFPPPMRRTKQQQRSAGPRLDYTFITDDRALVEWADRAGELDWLAFDTEFIGEKRYRTLVCLIQVATEDGLFLIDPIAIGDLTPFLDLVGDGDICKITHAGENDYRLLFQNYGTRPRNLVDTQLASGFLSEQYPVNFKRLADEHLGIQLKKGFAVVDWTKRPLPAGALKYALEDVAYLRDMYDVVMGKLEDRGRAAWFRAEMQTWEDVRRYEKTLLDEVKGLGAVYKMRRAEKLFTIRMVEWRRRLAEKRDHSREMVLATKDMGAVIKLMRNGRNAITGNRHLRNKSWTKHLDAWQRLYEQPATPEEEAMLPELVAKEVTDLRQEIVGEIVYKYLTYRCLQDQIAIDLVVPRVVMRELRIGNQDALRELLDTWRREYLGDDVLDLLANTERLEPVLEGRALRFAEVS